LLLANTCRHQRDDARSFMQTNNQGRRHQKNRLGQHDLFHHGTLDNEANEGLAPRTYNPKMEFRYLCLLVLPREYLVPPFP
jgi:hypothetical protein